MAEIEFSQNFNPFLKYRIYLKREKYPNVNSSKYLPLSSSVSKEILNDGGLEPCLLNAVTKAV